MKFLQIGNMPPWMTVLVILIIIAIRVVPKIFKNNKKKQEIKQAAEARIREESLDKMILNEHEVNNERGKAYNPYEVSYENGIAVKQRQAVNQTMVSLEEKNDLSTKKFVLNPAKVIRIGSAVQGNDIVVQGNGISAYQCEIFGSGDHIFVRNKSHENRTILVRKREQAIVDEKGLRLQSGDRIVLGKVIYVVSLINC